MASAQRRKRSLFLQISLYITAGILHFAIPDFYLSVIPKWMPYPLLCVQLSGMVEIVLGLCLLMPNLQKLAAHGIVIMLIVFLVLVHIPMALHFTDWSNWMWYVALARLPLQWVLIKWARAYTRGKTVSFTLMNE